MNGCCECWECWYRVVGAVYLVQKGHLLSCCEHCQCWYRVVGGAVNAVNGHCECWYRRGWRTL